MRTFPRNLALASMLTVCSIANSFAQESKKEPSGSISGRVVVGGKPVGRVTVILSPSDMSQMQQLSARATTDEEGHFTLKSIPAGSYKVAPHTPALVVGHETSMAQPGKTVTLADGEEVDGIDFSLVKGGVITGRVTDADGRPVIEQRINLLRVEDRGPRTPSNFNPFMFSTDDRGVYRIFGLMPGRYKVSVGEASDGNSIRIGFGAGSYPRTFHPDVSEESRAPIIEVISDSEATGIDIKLGRPSRAFTATGRIIDADTGKPVANLQYGHGPVNREQRMSGGFGFSGNRTNANGEFRIEGLSPGRYAAFTVTTEQIDFYSEPVIFEISDSDVNALEIKTRRGSSISGAVVVEGSDNPDVLARLSKLELRATVLTEELAAPSMAPIRISPDGSFSVIGLRPGKTRIVLSGFGSEAAKGFSLLRVEREGVVMREGLEVVAGENVSGVRVVLGYGTCVLRGQLRVQGGELPPGSRLIVTVAKTGSDGMRRSAAPDARGRFSVDWLLPGEYEITVSQFSVTPSVPGGPPPLVQANRTLAKQNVIVTNGVEADVTLIVDLASKDKDGEK